MHYFFLIILCSLSLNSCSDHTVSLSDSNPTVTIGNQTWMSKNLDVATFQNGDIIPEAKTEEELNSAIANNQPAWCYYNFDPANGTIYGRLYNWHAVNDQRKIAPIGFHVASDAEWTQLTTYLGTDSAGAKMKSTVGWSENGSGTNLSGFNALPGGGYGYEPWGQGYFSGIGGFGFWWSSTGDNEYTAWGRDMYNRRSSVGRFSDSKSFYFSVRCIKD